MKKGRFACATASVAAGAIALVAPKALANEAEPNRGSRMKDSALEQRAALPASNQWVFDRAKIYVYLGARASGFLRSSVSSPRFDVNFSEQRFSVPKLTTLIRLWPGSDLSLWGQYSLGVVNRLGTINETRLDRKLASENADFFAVPLQGGLQLHYKVADWLIPFAGYQLSQTFYRISSSLSGAERQGSFVTHGPILGVNVPLPLSWQIAAFAQWESHKIQGISTLARDSRDTTVGLGWYF